MDNREAIERGLQRLIDKCGVTDMTVEMIKNWIYEESGPPVTSFKNFQRLCLDKFESKGGRDTEIFSRIIKDAWNYFPHKKLDGKCPYELVLEARSMPKS